MNYEESGYGLDVDLLTIKCIDCVLHILGDVS